MADLSESLKEQLERLHLIASGDRDCDMSDNDLCALRAVLMTLAEAEADNQRLREALDEARATNTRLNRRVTLAEAAVDQKVESFEQRSKRSLRAHYFNRGREYGRAEGIAAANADTLAQVEAAIRAKFTPALNTGTAMDALVLVGAALREVAGTPEPTHDVEGTPV